MEHPAILTTAEAAALLRDMADGLDSGDTDEGSIEVLQPPWEVGDDFYEQHMPPEMRGWYRRVTGTLDSPYWKLDYGAVGNRVLVRASYRIGRSVGQGGVRLVNARTAAAAQTERAPSE